MHGVHRQLEEALDSLAFPTPPSCCFRRMQHRSCIRTNRHSFRSRINTYRRCNAIPCFTVRGYGTADSVRRYGTVGYARRYGSADSRTSGHAGSRQTNGHAPARGMASNHSR